MTAGRINQVCMQPYPNHTKAYCCYHWFAPGAHGLVNCGYTNSGWEAVELQASVGCTTTLPSQAQREDIDIREQATSRRYKEPCTHPSLPRQQAWNSPRKTSSNNAPAHPQQQQHDHVNEPCLKYSNCSLPAMCRPKAPTKTHTCSDWVKGDTECQIFAVHTPVLNTDYQHMWNHLPNYPPQDCCRGNLPQTSSNNPPPHPQQQHCHVNEPCLKCQNCCPHTMCRQLPTMCRPDRIPHDCCRGNLPQTSSNNAPPTHSNNTAT